MEGEAGDGEFELIDEIAVNKSTEAEEVFVSNRLMLILRPHIHSMRIGASRSDTGTAAQQQSRQLVRNR